MHRARTLYDFAATAVAAGLGGLDRVRLVIHRGLRPRPTTLYAAPRRSVDTAGAIPWPVEAAGSDCCVRIEGLLDTHNAPEIRSLLDSIISARPPLVIVDLERLTKIDSSGVGAIVSLHKRVKAYGGFVVVKGLQGQPLAVCKLLKLDRIFAPAPPRSLVSRLIAPATTDAVPDALTRATRIVEPQATER